MSQTNSLWSTSAEQDARVFGIEGAALTRAFSSRLDPIIKDMAAAEEALQKRKGTPWGAGTEIHPLHADYVDGGDATFLHNGDSFVEAADITIGAAEYFPESVSIKKPNTSGWCPEKATAASQATFSHVLRLLAGALRRHASSHTLLCFSISDRVSNVELVLVNIGFQNLDGGSFSGEFVQCAVDGQQGSDVVPFEMTLQRHILGKRDILRFMTEIDVAAFCSR